MNSVLVAKERRKDTRLDFAGRLFFQTAAPADRWAPPTEETFPIKEMPSARIKNVGSKGCCLILDQPLEKSLVLKIELPLIQESFSIPTLAEVRWMCLESDPEQYQYKVGVRFLL